MQNKIRLQEIIWSTFLLLILIKSAIKNTVTAVISLYMVTLENPENQNSAIWIL